MFFLLQSALHRFVFQIQSLNSYTGCIFEYPEANKLKNIQLYLEKNNILLTRISKYEDEFNLFDYYVETEKQRKHDTDQINNELRRIWELLQEKKKLLCKDDVDVLDLQSFKQDMIELQEKIFSLRKKLSSNGEVLKDQEKTLNDVNEIFNRKLEDWEKPVKVVINKPHYSLLKNTGGQSSDHKEVVEFMDFVNKSNGHENGWSVEDHQLFLKLRQKYKNIDDLAINLNKLLPDISVDAIKEHEAWTKKYLFLKNKKNEALKLWRKQKMENSCQNGNGDDYKTGPLVKSKILKIKNENVQEQIAMWRAEKEEKRQQEQIYQQLKNEQKKRLEEGKKRIQQQVKQVVGKWREAKVVKAQHEKFQKEMDEQVERKIRAATANRMIKQFQSHDDWFIAKMRSNRLKEQNNVRKRSKSSYTVDRDPERILKPTKQWISRTKTNSVDDTPSSFIPNIRQIPKLKIPEWRKTN